MRPMTASRVLARVLVAGWQLTAACLPAAVIASAGATEAWAQARSSGGYSRPRASSRTPSFGGGGGYRAPSSSGGYSLPGGGRRPSVAPYGSGSAFDRSYSRESSGAALRRMRERQAQQQRPSPPPVTTAPGSAPTGGGFGFPGGFGGGFSRGGSGGGAPGGYYPAPRGNWPGTGYGGGWFRDRGWSPSGSVLGGPSSFGIWNAALLWFLLDTLNRPGHADFFRNNRDEPGAREWRAEAERLARNDAELRRKLDELDRRMGEGAADATPEPGALPPDVPPEVALAPDDARTPTAAPSGEGGGGRGFGVMGAVLAGGGLLAFLAWRRARASRGSGNGTMGTGSVINSAGVMLRNKAEGRDYVPSRFRVGMTVTVDPTPFLLLGGDTAVPRPRAADSVSVAEVGRIGEGANGIVRLYLPEGRDMFQLHLDAKGEPAECRYFGLVDEVAPADEAEWAAWLDPQQGMIGWPEFQTKDGRVYARAWAPGGARVEPRTLVERVEGVNGAREVRSQAMLYAAPTNAAAPAPSTEYVLVATVEDGERAWVEIRAGIDVNPASLSLA